MARFYSIKSILATAALIVLLAASAGCTQGGDIIKSDPYKAYLHVNTMSLSGETVDGVEFSSIRLIVVDRLNSKIVFNKSTAGGLTEEPGTPSGSGKFVLNLKSGYYTMCVVANETAAMAASLASASDMADLGEIIVAGSFGETDVPLYRQQDFILRVKSNDSDVTAEVSTDEGTTWKEALDMELLRTQCKVSLWLRKKNGSPDEVKITKVELCNYPDKSYMITRVYDPASPQVRSVYENAGGLSIGDNIPDGNDDLTTYTPVFGSGNIFPEQCITSKGDASKAAYLKIYATYGSLNTTYTVRLRNDLGIENYDLTRNTHYKVYGTIETTGDLSAIYFAPVWQTEEVSGDIAVPYLNVSELAPSSYLFKDKDGIITPLSPTYSCYFWTNRPVPEISISDVADADDPLNIYIPKATLHIIRNSVSADGLPDVAGRIDLNMDNESINNNYSITGKNYRFSLKAGEVTRSINYRLYGKITPYMSDLVPATGAITVTDYNTSNAQSTTGTSEFTVFMDDNISVSCVSPTYDFRSTLTEKERILDADNNVRITYTVSYSVYKMYPDVKDVETITVNMKDKISGVILDSKVVTVTITKINK